MFLSGLDYCNGLLEGAPKCQFGQLSAFIKAATHLVLVLLWRNQAVFASTSRVQTFCVCSYMSVWICNSLSHVIFPLVSSVKGFSQLCSTVVNLLSRICSRYRFQYNRLSILLEHLLSSVGEPGNITPVDLCDPVSAFSVLGRNSKHFLEF